MIRIRYTSGDSIRSSLLWCCCKGIGDMRDLYLGRTHAHCANEVLDGDVIHWGWGKIHKITQIGIVSRSVRCDFPWIFNFCKVEEILNILYLKVVLKLSNAFQKSTRGKINDFNNYGNLVGTELFRDQLLLQSHQKRILFFWNCNF